MSNRHEDLQQRPLKYVLLAVATVGLALVGYAGYVLYPRFGLPAAEGASLVLLAFAAGVASFFSPCSFPLLVTLLARHSGTEVTAEKRAIGRSRARVFTFAAALASGASLFFLLSGALLAVTGEALFAGVTFTSPAGRIIRAVVGGMLVILGLIQLGRLPFTLDAVAGLATPLMRAQARERGKRPVRAFTLLGFAYPLAGFG